MLDHKIAQGAAELGQALNSQADAYVPYGAGQAPLEVEGPATDYQSMLREASQGQGRRTLTPRPKGGRGKLTHYLCAGPESSRAVRVLSCRAL